VSTNAQNIRSRKPGALLAALLGAVGLLGLLGPAAALAAPVVEVDSSHYPAVVPAGSHAQYELIVRNTGDANTTGQVTLNFTVPAGLSITKVTPDTFNLGFGVTPLWSCSTPNSQTASCVGPGPFGHIPIEPGKEACKDASLFGLIQLAKCRINVIVKVDPGLAPAVVTPTIATAGGGSVTFNGSDPTEIGAPAKFALTGFDGRVLKANGDPATQAGSHPHTASTEFRLTTVVTSAGGGSPIEELKDVTVRLPPGFVGNPQAYPRCTQAKALAWTCPPESQVGFVTILNTTPNSPKELQSTFSEPVFNMQAGPGTPALFTFNIASTLVQIYAKVRTGDDYGLDVITRNIPSTIPTAGVDFTFWGVPADPSHDAERKIANGSRLGFGVDSTAPLKPFLSLPTSCVGSGPNNSVETSIEVLSWQTGATDSASFFSHDNTTPVPVPIGPEGCDTLTYTGPSAPSIEVRPTTNVGDAPSGLDIELTIPQNSEEICPPAPENCAAANAHLKDTVVRLPEGLVVNPSSANGLEGCSSAEIGLISAIGATPITTTAAPAKCPDASKVARVQVETPLLDHPLEGSAYIADPFDNPFNSLLALYIALDDPETGIVVKLAGEVTLDPRTGRVTAVFEDNPQLPFETFSLQFKRGPHGALRTPAICGNHTTTSSLAPWSGAAAASPSDTWAISQNCAAAAAALPHSPSFDAGAVSPIAGVHSPFVVNLRRADGTQNFRSLTVTPPPGLVAKLAGTAICPEAALAAAAQKSGNEEKTSPSCPAASRVGSAVASAGAGPAPYHAPGVVYLSGPYKGAPLSLAIVTPATAGPFDLGTVVVRAAIYVDPKTAQITAVSDPIPSILEGIPLDVRAVQVALDKPQFSLNPTSCNPMAVNGSIVSTLGAVASLDSRFQLGECGRLGFKPTMTLSLKGGTTRGKHPALTAVLTPGAGNANLASISIALPPSEFLDQANIGTVCTRVQFAADQCPAASIYGTATVATPLLDYPLQGNVYLRSSDNKLPDLVPAFQGPPHQPIELESAGRTDTLKGGLRNTFSLVPDAPFSKLVVQLQGGPDKGLLINSRNICQKAYRALVKARAHNGKEATLRPKMRANCKGKQRKRKAKRSAR
jgi:hypothetical protein